MARKVNYENQNYFLSLVKDGTLLVTYDGKVFNTKNNKQYGLKCKENNYPSIAVKVNGKTLHQLIHRLVFIVHGGILTDEFPLVNHIDGNKHNSHFENLEASNDSHNIKHAYETGLHVVSIQTKEQRSLNLAGEKSSSAKITNLQASEIRNKYLAGGYTHRQLAKEYGVAHKRIGEILRNQTFKDI